MQKFNFPSYFGFNWDALFDCLCDLTWIEQKKIVLVHDKIPHLDKENLKIYLEVLHDVVKCWSDEEEHIFMVIFPEKDKYLIQKMK